MQLSVNQIHKCSQWKRPCQLQGNLALLRDCQLSFLTCDLGNHSCIATLPFFYCLFELQLLKLELYLFGKDFWNNEYSFAPKPGQNLREFSLRQMPQEPTQTFDFTFGQSIQVSVSALGQTSGCAFNACVLLRPSQKTLEAWVLSDFAGPHTLRDKTNFSRTLHVSFQSQRCRGVINILQGHGRKGDEHLWGLLYV